MWTKKVNLSETFPRDNLVDLCIDSKRTDVINHKRQLTKGTEFNEATK